MAKKTYRTAQGKMVDFGALLSQNENVPALGNMNVNARGDEIAPGGDIVKTREQVMREYNDMNTMVPQDGSIPESAEQAIVEDDFIDWEPKIEAELVKTEESNEPVSTEPATPSGGLAASIAATKTVKNTTVVAPPKSSDKAGVTRL